MKKIYICGCDGSGKTSLIDSLITELAKVGLTTKKIWIRSPKYFSKILMAYCRLLGYTKYFIKEGTRYGYQDFSKSKFISCLFPFFQYIDLKIALFFKDRNHLRDFVFYDRYILDTLADLIVSTNQFSLHKKWIGKRFLDLMPPDLKCFVVSVDEANVRNRKVDTRYDPKLASKIKTYKILAEDLNIEIIDNNNSFEETFKTLYKKLELYNERI